MNNIVTIFFHYFLPFFRQLYNFIFPKLFIFLNKELFQVLFTVFQGMQSERESVLNVHWKDWCWSWNSNTLATWCEELTHLNRPWCWERLKAGGEGDDRGWDGWMAELTQWAWVWVNSGSWWWTGRPGLLRFMGFRRIGHDWATKLNWTELFLKLFSHLGYYTMLSRVSCARVGFPGGLEGKECACNAGDTGSIPGSGRSPGVRNGNPTPVFLPGKFHGQRSFMGSSPRGRSQTQLSD